MIIERKEVTELDLKPFEKRLKCEGRGVDRRPRPEPQQTAENGRQANKWRKWSIENDRYELLSSSALTSKRMLLNRASEWSQKINSRIFTIPFTSMYFALLITSPPLQKPAAATTTKVSLSRKAAPPATKRAAASNNRNTVHNSICNAGYQQSNTIRNGWVRTLLADRIPASGFGPYSIYEWFWKNAALSITILHFIRFS